MHGEEATLHNRWLNFKMAEVDGYPVFAACKSSFSTGSWPICCPRVITETALDLTRHLGVPISSPCYECFGGWFFNSCGGSYGVWPLDLCEFEKVWFNDGARCTNLQAT